MGVLEWECGNESARRRVREWECENESARKGVREWECENVLIYCLANVLFAVLDKLFNYPKVS